MDVLENIRRLLRNEKSAYATLSNTRFKDLVLKLCHSKDEDVSLKAKRIVCSFLRFKTCHDIMKETKEIHDLAQEDSREGKYIYQILFNSNINDSDIKNDNETKRTIESNLNENPFKIQRFLVEVNGCVDEKDEEKLIEILKSIQGIKKIQRHSNKLLVRFLLTIDMDLTSLAQIGEKTLLSHFIMHSIIKKDNREILVPCSTKNVKQQKSHEETVKYPTINNANFVRHQISNLNLKSRDQKSDSFIESFRSFFQNSFYW